VLVFGISLIPLLVAIFLGVYNQSILPIFIMLILSALIVYISDETQATIFNNEEIIVKKWTRSTTKLKWNDVLFGKYEYQTREDKHKRQLKFIIVLKNNEKHEIVYSFKSSEREFARIFFAFLKHNQKQIK